MSLRILAASSLIGFIVYDFGYWKGQYDGRQMGAEDTLDVLMGRRLAANEWQREAKSCLIQNKKKNYGKEAPRTT